MASVDKLVLLLAAEIERDGGIAQAKRLPMYSPAIRKLLADRRLLPFLRSMPQTFTVLGDESAGSVCRVRMADGWTGAPTGTPAETEPLPQTAGLVQHTCRACAAQFRSRSALFKHIKSNLCTAAVEGAEHVTVEVSVEASVEVARVVEAVTCALRHRQARVDRRAQACETKEVNGPDREAAPLIWLCTSRKSKVKPSLVDYMRSAATGLRRELLSAEWWQHATQSVLALLEARPDVFCVHNPHSPDFSETTVQLVGQPVAPTRDADSEAAEQAIWQRVIDIISGQRMVKSASDPNRPPPGKGKHFLGKLATDVGLQQLLQGRELIPVLQRCPCIDGPTQLDSGGWYIKLTKQSDHSKESQEGTRNSTRVPSHVCEPTVVPIIQVVFTATGMCVVEKPSGVSTEQLVQWVSEQDNWPGDGYSVNTVSRLDQPTSGALVLPTNTAGEHHLLTEFKEHRVSKTYHCLVLGETELEGSIETKLKVIDNRSNFRVVVHHQGKPATTPFQRIRLVEREGVRYSLLAVQPLTGRTHQIRVHMQSIGHPLVGDSKYNNQKQARKQAKWCQRLFLHASRLELQGIDGAVDVTVGLDAELQATLDSLIDIASIPVGL